MRSSAPAPFKCKLFLPCKRILQFLKPRFRKALFIRALGFRHFKSEHKKSKHRKVAAKVLSVFRSLRPLRDMDRVMELKSFSDVGYNNKAPFPSPITPAYVRMSAANQREVSVRQDVEDACRSFENYLVGMIVEEGKTRDLMDVEELLYCWKNLKSPVFIDLVCRFYGELCRDLFSNSNEEDVRNSWNLVK